MIDALSSTELDVEQLEQLVDEENEDHEAAEDKAADNKRVFGRDKNGQYKNHANFVKLRNKINSQELKHDQMFENINRRLNDNTFLQQAIEAAGDIEITNDLQTEEDSGAPAPQAKPSDAVFEATAPSK